MCALNACHKKKNRRLPLARRKRSAPNRRTPIGAWCRGAVVVVRREGMRCGGRAGRSGRLPAAALLLALLAPLARADVIFRVPEVVVRHAATARAVGSGGLNRTAGGDSSRAEPQGVLEVRYEEYYVEHDVSTTDARRAAANLDLLEDVDDTELLRRRRPQPLMGVRIGCGVCSRRDLEYCETRVLADHCCCEGPAREPFPWLPHTCYAGPAPCRPLARSCVHYTRLRDCCCFRRLAERWKGILLRSGSRRGEGVPFGWLLPLATLALTHF
ncbi:unnamed protein product, partial [Iphiclides podalirius]